MAETQPPEKQGIFPQQLALGRPRREAKELDTFLKQVLPAPARGYSRALLGRALAEFSLRSWTLRSKIYGPIVLLALLPILVFAVTGLGGTGWDEFGFLVAAYYLEILVVLACFMGWTLFLITGERRRMCRRAPRQEILDGERAFRSTCRQLILVILGVAALALFLGYLLEPGELLPSTIKATATVVWGTLLLWLWWLGQRRILVMAAPQPVLVRSLANALGFLLVASPAEWRNIRYRRRAAAQLGAAAAVIEGPTLRILADIPIPGRTPEWRQVRDSAAGLRRLAARMVTRGMEARPEIELSVAAALVAAVDGSVINVESASPTEDEAAIPSRLGMVLHTARNVVIGLLPAIGVAAIILGGDRYGWEWAQEARPLLIQFAVVSLLIGLMSALDPSGYSQRLSAITGAGGSLFGRR